MARVDSSGVLDDERLSRVRSALLEWFAEHGSTLPWRRDSRPYAVLVSEFMLQQTQRERVAPKFIEFMQRFPDLDALAEAPAAAVIRAWQGLGYNGRALRLHQTARSIVAAGGMFPRDTEQLRRLPGVGRYTAGAIACFGFGEQASFVDTNVRRVLRRVFWGEPYPEPSAKDDERLAAMALPPGRAVEWNSALMDVGALICRATLPRCKECPLCRECLAVPALSGTTESGLGQRQVAEPASRYRTRRERSPVSVPQPFKDTDRYLRGRLVDALRKLGDGETTTLDALAHSAAGVGLPPDEERTSRLVAALEKEGMIAASDAEGERRFRLPD